jgi:hypothetical protein
MKRLLVLFAVLVPLSLFVAGCGGSGGSGGSSGKKAIEQTQEQGKKFMQEQGKNITAKATQGGTPGEAAKK